MNSFHSRASTVLTAGNDLKILIDVVLTALWKVGFNFDYAFARSYGQSYQLGLQPDGAGDPYSQRFIKEIEKSGLFAVENQQNKNKSGSSGIFLPVRGKPYALVAYTQSGVMTFSKTAYKWHLK